MIRLATPKDLLFIRDLQRRFTNQIGFIPSAGVERELNRGRILLGAINNQEAGFLLTIPHLTSQPCTTAIIQTAVRLDAQRLSLGSELVNTLARTARDQGNTILQAWCKANLEANLFWQAQGFTAVATRNGGNGKHVPHILWRQPLTPTADLSTLPIEQYNRSPGGRFARR